MCSWGGTPVLFMTPVLGSKAKKLLVFGAPPPGLLGLLLLMIRFHEHIMLIATMFILLCSQLEREDRAEYSHVDVHHDHDHDGFL